MKHAPTCRLLGVVMRAWLRAIALEREVEFLEFLGGPLGEPRRVLLFPATLVIVPAKRGLHGLCEGSDLGAEERPDIASPDRLEPPDRNRMQPVLLRLWDRVAHEVVVGPPPRDLVLVGDALGQVVDVELARDVLAPRPARDDIDSAVLPVLEGVPALREVVRRGRQGRLVAHVLAPSPTTNSFLSALRRRSMDMLSRSTIREIARVMSLCFGSLPKKRLFLNWSSTLPAPSLPSKEAVRASCPMRS